MRVLAFDVTGPVVTVGLAADGKPVGRQDVPAVISLGNVLESAIDTVLSRAGWSRRDVQGLTLVTGPGSLTATRIGWATAAGWARASIPVTGWPTPFVHHRYWREWSRSARFDPRRKLIAWRITVAMSSTAMNSSPNTRRVRRFLLRWGIGIHRTPTGVRIVGPGVIGREYRERWRAALRPQVELADYNECLVGGEVLAVWGEAGLAAKKYCRSINLRWTMDFLRLPSFERTMSDDVATIRPMRASDLASVAAIEAAAFSDPWPLSAFRECLRVDNRINLVLANESGEIVAYLCGQCVADEMQIHTLPTEVCYDFSRLVGKDEIDTVVNA